MDPSDLRPSPRRELQLQGPRPTPLRVSKDSYKIKKPPMAPPGPAHHPPPPHPQNRAPVIIYTVSPKVIHTNPGDFMTLVQRLTGSSSSAADAASGGGDSLPSPSFGDGGAISPAARLATYERAARSPDGGRQRMNGGGVGDDAEVGGGGGVEIGRAAAFPGILSPVPSSLPPISPSLFSPPSDPAFLSFLHDLSPGFAAAAGGGGGFSTSPSSFLMTPTIPSPGVWDLFNQWPGS